MRGTNRLFTCGSVLLSGMVIAGLVKAQESPARPASDPRPAAGTVTEQNPAAAKPDKRIFGVIPNYRTADGSIPFQPITAKQKFAIASKDSFDWPVYPVSGAFAALYQLENQNPSFGQGMKGYGNRYVRSFGDQAIGNLMTEAIFPALLREDPRYFRRGTGRFWGRAGRAASAIFVARRDSGGWGFNFAEVAGNSATTALSNAYYPETRTARDNLGKLATQLATDSFSNVLKEFWPDIKRRLFARRRDRS